MEKRFYVSSSPHISDRDSTQKIMFTVTAALIPAAISSVYFFGLRALWIMVISILSAVAAEALAQKMRGRPITVSDGSAILTGILLAFNVSSQVPLWLPAVGSFFAIIAGKHVFGGLGYNPMNPALLGRAFLLASWPTHMTLFDKAVPKGGTTSGIDIMTSATPLNVLKQSKDILANQADFPVEVVTQAHEAIGKLYDSVGPLFWGQVGGCIGETSVFALLLGAAYLMYKHYIGWRIPFSYIGTVALLSWIFGGSEGLFSGNIVFNLFSGGLILGAFFMATDMVTSPVTPNGRLIFGIGCGVITVVIRQVGGYPEGVSYSILLMNLLVPLLDRLTRPKVFGGVKKS